jgi:rhodanese-related sulfurtransferase
MRQALLTTCALSFLITPAVHGADTDAALEAMLEIFEFSPYQGGNILSGQIPAKDWEKFYIIDTRRSQDYEKSHIPGAVNIEWRRVLSRRDELPDNISLLLYCNTGSLSAQAALALKVAGKENVFILTGGYDAWKAAGGFNAYSRISTLRDSAPDI